jgi:alkaline phosphatase
MLNLRICAKPSEAALKRFPVSLLLLLVVCLSAPAADAKKAKNVVLFLGDGTGLPTVHAASILRHGKPHAFFIHTLPNLGLSETSSASDWVTDSAAGMTAIVTGQKTHNGVISQADDAQRRVKDGTPLKTILEYAEERGLSTGVVTNSPAADATPAACYAHSNDRGKWGEIFAQIVKPRFGDGIEIVIGGGRDQIFKQTTEFGFDIGAELKARGYEFLDGPASLKESASAKKLVALYEQRAADIPLAEAVDTALEILRRNSKGFFLMVESNNHFTDIKSSLDLMANFDSIIRSTAEKLRGTDTLILFTADHSYDLRFPGGTRKGEDIVQAMKVEGHHNAEEVLVLAGGPGAERVHGFFPNTHLFHVMMSAYGWKPDSPAARTE